MCSTDGISWTRVAARPMCRLPWWGLSRRASPIWAHTERRGVDRCDAGLDQFRALGGGERVGDPGLPGADRGLELHQGGDLVDVVGVRARWCRARPASRSTRRPARCSKCVRTYPIPRPLINIKMHYKTYFSNRRMLFREGLRLPAYEDPTRPPRGSGRLREDWRPAAVRPGVGWRGCRNRVSSAQGTVADELRLADAAGSDTAARRSPWSSAHRPRYFANGPSAVGASSRQQNHPSRPSCTSTSSNPSHRCCTGYQALYKASLAQNCNRSQDRK